MADREILDAACYRKWNEFNPIATALHSSKQLQSLTLDRLGRLVFLDCLGGLLRGRRIERQRGSQT